MPRIFPPSHGNLRSTFEADPTVNRTIVLALGLVTVMAIGFSLVVQGLMR